MIGTTIGMLTIAKKELGQGLYPRKGWIGRCLCGGEQFLTTSQINRGQIWNCGCVRAGYRSLFERTRVIYSNISARDMCEAWAEAFSNFYFDVGPCPSVEHELVKKIDEELFSAENHEWKLRERVGVLSNDEVRILTNALVGKNQGLRASTVANESATTPNTVNKLLEEYFLLVKKLPHKRLVLNVDVNNVCRALEALDLHRYEICRVAKLPEIVVRQILGKKIAQCDEVEMNLSVEQACLVAKHLVLRINGSSVQQSAKTLGLDEKGLVEIVSVYVDFSRTAPVPSLVKSEQLAKMIQTLRHMELSESKIASLLGINRGVICDIDKIKQVIRHKGRRNKIIIEPHQITHKWFEIMRDRCLNRSFPAYRECGLVGIKICAEWLHNYDAFLRDMGECPEGYVLKRMDVKKDFSKENCAWVEARSVGYEFSLAEVLIDRDNRCSIINIVDKYKITCFESEKVDPGYHFVSGLLKKFKKSKYFRPEKLAKDELASIRCKEHYDRGWTLEQIAEKFGYNRRSVYAACRRLEK